MTGRRVNVQSVAASATLATSKIDLPAKVATPLQIELRSTVNEFLLVFEDNESSSSDLEPSMIRSIPDDMGLSYL
jgi:hypothetical protein